MKSGYLHPLILSCIVTVLVPWSTQALSVRIADTTAEAGASAITVSIEVDNALGIAGGDLTLIYDAAALTAKRVATGSLAAASGLTVIGNTAGVGQVKIAMAGAIGLRSASGVLTTIAFDVSANAIPGTYSLELTRATFFNEQARTISVRHIASGTFTVASKARRGVEVKIENVSGNLGDTGIEVSITVEDGTGLAGADLTLTYEASVLTAKEVTPGSLAAASGFMFTGNTAGPGLVKIAMAGATGIPSGGGALAIVILSWLLRGICGCTRGHLGAQPQSPRDFQGIAPVPDGPCMNAKDRYAKVPGETESGSAGTQPSEGYSGRWCI